MRNKESGQKLIFHFLGTPEVVLGDRALKFPTQKSLALLIYLAVEGGYHSREKLMAFFWPESDTRHGQASLRNDLHRLRTTLSDYADNFLTDREQVAFELGDIDGDWNRLEAAFSLGTIQALQTVLALYRGDFLDGFTLSDAPDFDEWASAEREHWHYRLSQVLEKLAILQSESGDLKGCVETARRWIAHDPLNEAGHRQLMQALFLTEGTAAALEVYEGCRKTLMGRVATQPSPETIALSERLRTGSLDYLRNRSRPPIATIPYSLPFVGRASEYARLVAKYHTINHQNIAQRLSVITLEGEAGIGKTRLATEFLTWTIAQGSDVLHGQAFEMGRNLPYQPVVDALRARLDRENAPEDLVNDVWLAELSRLLPELRDRYPDLPPANDDMFTRNRLFEAIATLGAAFAKRKPVVLFLDDLQWIDTASLDLLYYLVRRWRESGSAILIMLSIRSEVDPGLDEWLLRMTREASLERITLKPITSDDTRQLIGSVMNEPQEQYLAQWLFGETNGQPFFLLETIKVLFEHGVLKPNSVGFVEVVGDISEVQEVIAPGIREVILARLKHLAREAMALLMAAAAIGRRCNFDSLCRVAGLTQDDGLVALETLLRNRLLLETTDRLPYAFSHDKIRSIVYEEIGEERRRLYHRRALAVLADADEAPAVLAHHASLAGLVEPAYRYHLLAGDIALSLFAVRDAIKHYEQAQKLDVQQIEVSNWQHLYLQLGRAYELDGHHTNAHAVYQKMLDQATDQSEAQCAALNHLAMLAVHSHDFDTGSTLLRQAATIAEKNNYTPALVEVELNLAQLTHHLFDFAASLTHSERALGLTRDLGQREWIARTLNSLAYAHILLGLLDRGEPEMREAQSIYAELGNQAMESDCRIALAAIELWQGRAQESVAEARIAHSMSQKINNPWGEIYSSNWLAMGLLDCGAYEEALQVAKGARYVAQTHDFMPVSVINLLVLGNVYRTLMQLDAAIEIHCQVESMNLQPGPVLSQIKAELCTDHAFIGAWDRAFKYAREAVAYRRYHELPLVISPRWTETEALIRGGDITSAREDMIHWGELVSHIPRLNIPHLHSLACLAAGEIKEGYLRDAITQTENVGLLSDRWQLFVVLGKVENAKKIADLLIERMSSEDMRKTFQQGVNRFIDTFAQNAI